MRHRAIAVILCVSLVLAHAAPAAAGGRARVLSDAELDATFAQGLVIVDVSLALKNLAGRFDFDFAARTAINVPDAPAAGSRPAASVDFLGGLLSVTTDGHGSTSGATASSLPLGASGSVSFAVHAGPESGASARPGSPAPKVSVTFGGATGPHLGRVIGIVARDGGATARFADACVLIPTVNPSAVTPHAEAFQSVVWHLLVSHPALRLRPPKWESVG